MRLIIKIVLILSTLFFMITAGYAGTYGRTLCKTDGFRCKKIKGNQSWFSLFPSEHDRGIAMRLNRMNTDLYPGLVIAIPDDIENRDIMDFAPFPRQIRAPEEKVIVVDPVELAWGAYDIDGSLVRWGPISGGRDWCNDIDASCLTQSGAFRIFSLGSSDCYSTKFPLPDGGAPMPYCMYFHGGQALHGEPNGLPGYNASHGCVRLYVNDAEWLRYDFVEGPNENNHYQGTKVIVQAYTVASEE
ncbi:MAG: L,D-transpeptidase [Gammaproteobacteria bacterium]|nr:L,D-transpeptidase [Gammaproteobacteria bacterium]